MIPKMNLREYPVLDRHTREDGVRHYIDPTGVALPSVTTILSETADKQFLIEWMERVGEKAANKARNDGTALGTLVHTHLENYLLGQPRPGGNNLIRQMASRMADQIINRGLPQVDEIWGIEAMLYFPSLYAGTSDLIGVWKGKPAIMDFKNAKKMRKREDIDDYWCQGTAYAMAHDHLFGTEIETVVIFMVDRELKFETYAIEGDEFYKYSEMYQNRIVEYEDKMAKSRVA